MFLKCSMKIQFFTILSIMSLISFINIFVDLFLSICGKTLILLLVSYLMTIFIRKFRTKESVTSKGKAVLITGCDSGFGNRLAYKLNQNGFRVYATVLSLESEGSKQMLRDAVFKDKIHVLEMNVTKDQNIRHVYQQIKKDLDSNGDQLWAVVNNAGILTCGHLEWGTLDTYKKVFDVNVFGVVRVTRVFLPLIKASKGRIVNVVSVSGRVSFDNVGVYSMSKHAMIAFSDTLRREMHKFGIIVCTIEPGAFKTPILKDDAIQDVLQRTWIETDESVRKNYGENYFEKQKENALKYVKIIKMGTNIDIVVDDMMDAVINSEPNITYRPIEGLKSKIFTLLPVYLPSQLMDQMVYSKDKTIPEYIEE